jgi:hypothetical protein
MASTRREWSPLVDDRSCQYRGFPFRYRHWEGRWVCHHEPYSAAGHPEVG